MLISSPTGLLLHLTIYLEKYGLRTLLNKLIPLTLSTPGLAQSVEVEALARGGDGFMHIGGELAMCWGLGLREGGALKGRPEGSRGSTGLRVQECYNQASLERPSRTRGRKT